LSLSSPGRWTTLAVSQPDAAKASFSASVTSPARMLVQSFQPTMKREKSSRIVERENQPQPGTLR
jgi:hypothetical protein